MEPPALSLDASIKHFDIHFIVKMQDNTYVTSIDQKPLRFYNAFGIKDFISDKSDLEHTDAPLQKDVPILRDLKPGLIMALWDTTRKCKRDNYRGKGEMNGVKTAVLVVAVDDRTVEETKEAVLNAAERYCHLCIKENIYKSAKDANEGPEMVQKAGYEVVVSLKELYDSFLAAGDDLVKGERDLVFE